MKRNNRTTSGKIKLSLLPRGHWERLLALSEKEERLLSLELDVRGKRSLSKTKIVERSQTQSLCMKLITYETTRAQRDPYTYTPPNLHTLLPPPNRNTLDKPRRTSDDGGQHTHQSPRHKLREHVSGRLLDTKSQKFREWWELSSHHHVMA